MVESYKYIFLPPSELTLLGILKKQEVNDLIQLLAQQTLIEQLQVIIWFTKNIFLSCLFDVPSKSIKLSCSYDH